MTATTSPRVASLLAALRDARFPGALPRRQFTTVRKGFRTHERVEHLEPAIPIGTFTWAGANGSRRQLLTGITTDGEYVTMGGLHAGEVEPVDVDPVKVADALSAHARLHGVALVD